MGLDHDAALSVGYTIDPDNIPDQYRKHLERQVRLEDRSCRIGIARLMASLYL